MSGINIIQKYHGAVTQVASNWGATDVTSGVINVNGYTKLMVQYVCSSGWDRAGDIYILGCLTSNGAFTTMDATLVSGSKFSVTATDDSLTGAGKIYVVKNIPPFIKLFWDNTTTGTTGTLTVSIMPFNE